MIHLRIHLIYIAIIGFLAYQYWTKTEALDNAVQSIEHFDKLFKANEMAVSWGLNLELNNYNKIFEAYRTSYMTAISKKVKNATFISDGLSQWLEKQRTEFIEKAGGFDKKKNGVLVKRLDTQTSKQFFTDYRICEFRDSLIRFHSVILNVSDSKILEELKGEYFTLKLLQDENYWQSLRKLTAAEALVQFAALQNQMTLDKMSYIFSNLYSFSVEDIRFDAFKVAIAPQKAAIIEGEKFKADIYIASYSTRPGSFVKFFVNNQEVQANQGVAHFETTETKVGKQTIKAVASIQNPLTGQVTTSTGMFEYEVLPKCSKNCQ